MSQPILEVRALKVTRGGVTVLDIPGLTIMEGEFLSFIGPNGAGKSTLLLSLAVLLKPSTLDMRFRGMPITRGAGLLDYRRRLAMVFQDPLLFDTNVFNNVASGLKIRGMAGSRIKAVVEENLSLFGIAHLALRSARKLSGGEAQRTSLARAFATQPEIVLLDEPFTSLDPPTKEAVVADLGRVLRTRRATVIMATHDRMDAVRLSDRIAVMDCGRIVQTGTPFEVMHHPATEAVAAFVGIDTMLAGTVVHARDGMLEVSVDGRVVVAAGDFALGDHVLCLVHPEHVMIFPKDGRLDFSARNRFTGTVARIDPLGPLMRIEIDCGFILAAYVTRLAMEEMGFSRGMEVNAAFKATSVHVIRNTRA